ncbi:MAG: DEAD/DEAH box helicase [Candidatus ainarchaeum sp.]|nr:DEAD/DEAH box helicase [Candidatus ainarchaeum sp.]
MNTIKFPLIKEGTIETRLYQEVLVSQVIEKGNTLVVAPTALGKTIIAILLSAYKLNKNKDSKILFLAPTKPLVTQHEKSFKKFLSINEEQIVSITGTVKPNEREKIYQSATIINSTPQTIENDIVTGKIKLDKFDLIIFDEAHRAVGDYAYTFISKQIKIQNETALILALTASPGNEQEKIEEVCENLNIKNIEIKKSSDDDVLPYVNDIEIDWIKVDLPVEFKEIKENLESFQKKQLEVLKAMHIAVTENKKYYNRTRILLMQSQIRQKIMSNSNNPSYYAAASKCAALLKVSHAEELIETQGINALKNYFDKLKEEDAKGKSKASKLIMSNPEIQMAISLTEKLFHKKVEHPKYKELKKILISEFNKNPNGKAIVFNQYRDSIREVVKFINEEDKIKAIRFIGQAKKGDENGMSQKEQQQTLQELKDGKYNVIVTSSVAEEGLDIPAVDLVVFFEPVPSEIRTIQRRGRTGRFGKGRNIILMTKGTRDEAFYWTANAKEKRMQSTLKEMKANKTKMETNLIDKKQLKITDIKNEYTDLEEDEIMNENKIKKEIVKDIANEIVSENSKKMIDQRTLTNFIKDENQITIYVDSREQKSTVAKHLFEKECKIIQQTLPIGDFLLSEDIGVERKTISDFVSSIIDGRLFSQIVYLKENYKKPLIILEGNFSEIYTLRNINKGAIIGAISSISIDYAIPIIHTQNEIETSEYLYAIAKREQIDNKKEISLRVGRKGLTLKENQQYIMEGFPLVGPSLAKNLLKEFKSIKNIMNANEKDLQKVDKLGEKKAKEIRKIIEAEFKDE